MRFEERKKQNLLNIIIVGVFSFFFAAALLFGERLDSVENVDVKDFRLWLSLLVLTPVIMVVVRLLLTGIDLLQAKLARKMNSEHKAVYIFGKFWRHEDFLTFLTLLLCWLPVFLAVYPGFFVYDAYDEYNQVATRTFSTHHPLVHVLLLGHAVCDIQKLTGSYNLGIAAYIIIQMFAAASVFTFLLSYLRRRGSSRRLRLISLLYLGLFPTVVMFVLCSTKDTLFTLALLLLMICLLELGRDRDAFFAATRWKVLFVISGIAMMLLRNNGFYAFLVLIPILVILQKGRRRQLLFLTALAVGGCLFVNGGLKAALHADDSEYQELLTVPIQQITRTYKYAPEVFSTEDVDILHEVLSEGALSLYVPRLSDLVKYYFDNEAFAKDKGRYAALWLRVGMKKPLIYLNAWWMTSYGFWYPNTIINVYRGRPVYTFTYEDNSYFGYEVELPGVRESKIPWLDEVYRKLSLEIWKEKVPIVRWLFSPGAMFWLYAFFFVRILYSKRYDMIYPFLPIILLWLTVLLGPTYLPRYVLFLWFALPLVANFTFCKPRVPLSLCLK